MSLFGQSAIRPCIGPSVGESETRSGLSQVSVGMLLRKNDPSYPNRATPRLPVHSRALPSSVVRVSRGTASSTASLKPNVPAHGWLPVFVVFLTDKLRSRLRVAL